MNYKVNLRVGGVKFENLAKKKQEEVRKKVTSIYADQVINRVVDMMNEGKSKQEVMDYLGLSEGGTKDEK